MIERTRKQQRVINIICALALIAGMWLTSVDGIMRYFKGAQAAQYLFNCVFICLVLPACIGLSDLAERSHPEHFTTDQLRRKGIIK